MRNFYQRHRLPGVILFIILLQCFLPVKYLAAQPPPVTFIPVLSGLNYPMDVVHANDGTQRVFVIFQGGTILVYNPDFSLIGTFLTVAPINSGGEEGLLS